MQDNLTTKLNYKAGEKNPATPDDLDKTHFDTPKKVYRRYTVNRILLKKLMLEKGIEYFKDLAHRLGISESIMWVLISGHRWYPTAAGKIEKFLGAEEGSIFKKCENKGGDDEMGKNK